jgi:hypothetical protein
MLILKEVTNKMKIKILIISAVIITAGLIVYFGFLKDKQPVIAGFETEIPSGLVGWWTMDGRDVKWTSGTAATIIDRSNNGNNGILTNMEQLTAPVIGKIGQALSFDAVNDCVNVGLSASLDITGAVTVSAWVKSNYSVYNSGFRSIATKSSVAGSQATQQFHLADGGKYDATFVVGNTSTNLGSATVTNALPRGVWSHVLGTYNGTDRTTLYLNGVRVDTDYSAGFGALQQSGKNFNIGASHGSTPCNSARYDGTIDDVRIYNRALSASEAKTIYREGLKKRSQSNF